jgi:pimeloyl-ACP methyl ester carboxylesterase
MRKNQIRASVVALALIVSSLAAPAKAFQTFNFKSEATGETDHYAFAKPIAAQKGVPGILLVFFHGYGQNILQPFQTPLALGGTIADTIMAEEPGVAILSVSYGKTRWGSQGSLSDISKNILDVLAVFNANRIVLFGMTSGASVALNYACVAPPELKEKIAGVLALEPSGDLIELYNQSADGTVKPSLQVALGDPVQNSQAYKDASFLYNASKLDPKVKICVLATATNGFANVPAQKNVCKAIKKTGNKLLVLDTPPGMLPPVKVFKRAVAYVLHPGTK